MYSVNNRLILEPYKTDKSLRSKVTNAFATIDQKGRLHGLKVLANANICKDGSTWNASKGDIVYIREELLHSAPWVKNLLEMEGIDGQFMIVGAEAVEMIVTPQE